MDESTVPQPFQYFCRYDLDELCQLAYRKFVDHIPTVQLMQQAHDRHAREEVGIIALLDVDDDTVVQMMPGLTADERCSVLSYRQMLRRQLQLWAAKCSA